MKTIRLLLLTVFFLPRVGTAQRDPLKWPFAKTSVWNMPIHNNAVYTLAGIKDANNFEADEDVIIMSPGSAAIQVQTNNAGWSGQDRCPAQGATLFSAPIPANWIFDNTVWYGRTPNAGAAILLPNGKIKQTQPFAKCSQNVATSLYTWSENLCELKGECTQGAHGGSGLSSIGGTIRYGELTAGIIRHALKINLWGKENFFNGGGGYRWPATKADGGYNDSTAFNYYGGTNPEMRIGALLAIYKDAVLTSVANNSLGIETEAGLIIARAMQDYGAYTVDNTAYDSYAFIIENGPDGIVRNEFRQKFGFDLNVFGSLNNTPWARDLKRIFKSLYVISNNTDANNIGGGPTTDTVNRRAPLAPDFQAATSARTLKIMPLGDSKTEGGGTNNNSAQNSWRGYLRTRLIRNGFGIDYVGDRSNIAAGDTLPVDNNHAGHGGYTIGPDIQKFCPTCETTGLYEHIQDWLPAANPDVVLLAVGVNDMFGAENHAPGYARSAPDRYTALVNKILQLKPNVKLVLGTVEPVRYDVNWGGNPNDNNLGSLNARIRALADSSLTDNIFFADIRNKMLVNYSAADFFDDVHLSAQGAKKNADAWLEAVIPVLNDVPNNVPPVCSITSPANNAGFAAPATIQLAATATDADGTVKSVAFYNGSIKIGEDSTAPYTFSWNNVDEGAYLITAVATDNYFATKISSAVLLNVSSSDGYIKFTGTGLGSPGSFGNNGLTFTNALDGNIATYFDGATANGQWAGLDLGVAKIAKKIRYVPRATWASRITGGRIQGANSADFSDAIDLFTITTAPIEGVYNVARFTNTRFFQYYRFLSPNGGYGNIAEIEFWGDANDPSNQPPLCNLTSPAGNINLSASADVLLSAAASDPDGNISKVEFYQGNSLLGTATAAPYDFVWSNVPAGNYLVSAKATDNAGVTKSSPAISVNVNPNVSGPVLYSENFDTNTAAGWVLGTSGTWAPGTLKYRSNNAGGEHTAFYNTRSFTNYTFTIDGFATYGNDMGVIFNYQNASNYYLLAFNTNTKTASLKKKVAGTLTTIVTRSFTGRGVGTTHNVYIKNAGSLTSIRINGDTICNNVSTTNFTSGKIGIYAYFTPTVFDNVLVVSNNGSPAITVNTPVFNSIYTQPAVLPVTVTLADPDTTLTKVEFYNKDTLLATRTTSPYDIDLSGPTPGNYYLTAKASHSTGYAITSSLVAFAVNSAATQAPAVQIISPASQQVFMAPADIPIAATALDSDGSIARVDFYNGNALIGSDTTSPYQITWPNIKTGSYTIMARAIDNAGAVSNSATLNVTVLHPAPVAIISAPAANANITGLDVPISSFASSADGSISRVEFFSDTTLLATDSISPYTFNWKVPAGNYRLYVRATDNTGVSSTSDTVAVTVNGYLAPADNLLRTNPGFESLAGINYANGAYNAIPGWSLFNAAYNNIGVSTGSAAEGGKKLQIINAGYGETAATDFATVSPGNVYALSVSLRKTASRSATVSSPAQILIKWFDANGAFLTSVTSGNISGGPVTGWQTFTLLGTAPANAVKASAKVNVNLGTAPNTGLADFLVDNFVLYKLSDAKKPFVSIINPASDTSLRLPGTLTIQAAATDTDGAIAKVDFYIDTVLVSSDATFPYAYNWSGMDTGTYRLTARATDNHGLTTTSAPVIVIAVNLPVITIAGVAVPVIKTDSAYIILSAIAQTDQGSIASVSFYKDSALLGQVSSAPYSFKWLNSSPGNYTFTARAFANTGEAVTSQPFAATLVPGKLTLTSVCSANPALTRRWRVTSTYTIAVGFTWNVYGAAQNGSGTISGGDTIYFETATVGGSNTTILTYAQNVQVTKASGGQACAPANGRSTQNSMVVATGTTPFSGAANDADLTGTSADQKINGPATVAGVMETAAGIPGLKAYPVPLSNGNLKIQVNGFKRNDIVNLDITDMLGRRLLTRTLTMNEAGMAAISLPRSGFRTAGVFFVSVSCNAIRLKLPILIK